MSGELDFNNITTSVKDHYIPNLVDVIFESSALLSMLVKDERNLNAEGNMTESIDGGSEIIQPLMYGKGTAVGKYSGYDVVDISPSEFLTASRLQMKSYYSSITISREEQLKVSGGNDKKVLDLLDKKFTQAREQLKEEIANDLFRGSGDGLIGLDTAIDDTGIYGGIDAGVHHWWRSGKDTAVHTAVNMKNSNHASYLPNLFKKGWKACKHKNKPPNLILLPQDVWDIAEEINETYTRFSKPTTERSKMVANMGFTTLEYRGIPMVVDDFIDDVNDPTYMLNTEFYALYYHPKDNFEFTGFVKSANQPGAMTGQITFTGQTSISNRRHFYKWTQLNQ